MSIFTVSSLIKLATAICNKATLKAEKQITAANKRKVALAMKINEQDATISTAEREKRIAQMMVKRLDMDEDEA
ncbi:hypothetical protein IT774_07450 [Salinimonas marina]|uniref:Uncharacterized protein n=1 Tax=Salinimonas marina TaxID=2785918 RepID=A0A7S9DZS4_9ALTE|nr:hypothetical protein [Salinimonas marina]QPG06929.1 hypothetical protein IT774_07450 [Salinimonas marina]